MKNLTLIIPDVHHKWETAEKIIKAVSPTQTIFLGDYFDSFEETPETVFNTAEWLVQSVKDPTRIHLTGNHDMHYMYANRYFQCSGYTQWKYHHINDVVNWDTWSKLKQYHVIDNTWLLTHAGLHKHYIPDNIFKLIPNDKEKLFVSLSEYLNEEIIKGMRNQSWVFKAGSIRGGDQLYGGINWCDSREFIPTKGINQIFGHTVNSFIRWKNIVDDKLEQSLYEYLNPSIDRLINPNNSYNLCLDTACHNYATWDGHILKIYDWVTM